MLFETWIESDLKKLPTVMRLRGRFFSENTNANKVGVIVTDNGESVNLTGNVRGYIIKPDGTMINDIIGSRSGNRAWIVLPSSAYSQQGQITVTIKLINGTEVTTLGALEAYVYPSTL